jgi:putative aldouronate transport system permease protein
MSAIATQAGAPVWAEGEPAIAKGVRRSGEKAGWRRRMIRRHWRLYAMLSVPVLFLIVFNYLPLLGAQIAFRNYNPVGGIWGSPWVGLEQFRLWLQDPEFWPVMRNTLVLGVYSLLIGIPATVVLALAINEVRHHRFKKAVQSITYFPYFISVIVLVGMMQLVLSPGTGLFSNIFHAFGINHTPDLFGSPSAFASVYVWSGVWQTTGYGAVIYLGVLSTVDPALYEAARLDGASVLQKIRNVDIPAIKPTIVILLILSLGGILGVGFEKVLLLQTPLNLSTSQVVSTYVYQVGLVQDNFSFGTAVGLFNSVISFVLIVAVNFVAKRMSGYSFF